MKKTPQFIKDFSKEEALEERQQIAQSVRSKRQEYFVKTELNNRSIDEAEIADNEKEQELNERLENINKLKDEISRLSESGILKLLNYFELKKLQADLIIGQKTYEELKQEKENGLTEKSLALKKSDKNELPSLLLQEAESIVDEFYIKQEDKWKNSEYKKEDIEKYFSEDNLASLSIEEYILLLKRFPSEMVAHVTRQGIRDHLGHAYHLAGYGEYANGFKTMVADGRLRSPLGVSLVEEEKEVAIAKFLKLDSIPDKDGALENLNAITSEKQGEPGSYTDRAAIHFAAEEVADCYYGSEKGNEIFIAYPSTFIASQYYFSGQLNQKGDGYWNDQWVWANEEKGVDLNAGLVFIPEEAQVDKETGSRYKLNEEKRPIKNNEYLNYIQRFVDSDSFDDFAKKAMAITGKLTNDVLSNSIESIEELKPLRQKLEKDFDIIDPRLQWVILDYQNLFSILTRKKENLADNEDSCHSIGQIVEEALENEGILFKEATDKVNSKEYWELYFENNSKIKPAHIVYYKGGDPTKALNTWKEENGLIKTTADKDMGFSENNIQGNSRQATAGLDRFKTLAEKVIEKYYLDKNIKEQTS